MKHASLPVRLLLSTVCLLLATACANPRATPPQNHACPQTFVALPFAQLTLIDDLLDTRNILSFSKVRALCKQDKQRTMLVKVSFTLQLEKPLASHIRKSPLLVPLFAAITQDGKTLSARQSQRLLTTFDKKGRAQTSWLVALPASSPTSTPSASTTTLYLGFEGDNISLQALRANP